MKFPDLLKPSKNSKTFFLIIANHIVRGVGSIANGG